MKLFNNPIFLTEIVYVITYQPTGYADNLSLHVSSKGITPTGSIHRSKTDNSHEGVKLGVCDCEEVCSVIFLYRMLQRGQTPLLQHLLGHLLDDFNQIEDDRSAF